VKFKLAISFLTILPGRLKEAPLPGDLGRAAGWFPFIGAVLGILVAAAYAGVSLLFPPFLSAVLTAAVWIALTGGLHLDGLADCCDGLLNASSPSRRLEIMKDPRLGTFGGLGLVLAVLLKVACLYSLPPGSTWVAIPLAAAVARWFLLPAGLQPLARTGGAAADFSSGLNRRVFIPAVLVAGILTGLAGWRGLVIILFAHTLAWYMLRLARARLGGLTGDVYGLVVETAELAILAGFCVR
jgi:adenosylcobinamide-GDP ribazoletransferase